MSFRNPGVTNFQYHQKDVEVLRRILGKYCDTVDIHTGSTGWGWFSIVLRDLDDFESYESVKALVAELEGKLINDLVLMVNWEVPMNYDWSKEPMVKTPKEFRFEVKGNKS